MKIIILFLFMSYAFAQEQQWQHGTGTAIGTDIEAIRTKALNNARADALAKAGILIAAADTRLVSESGNSFTDFYSKFAESSTKGIILEERIVSEGEAKIVRGTTYEIKIEVEANIALQLGEPDPAFVVNLESSKQIVKEAEPFTLTVKSTKAGYLTIFNIFQDSLSVVFPNAIDKENRIEAGKPFVFPQTKVYDLVMARPDGKANSTEMFIAVVTDQNIPFPKLDQLKFSQGAIRLRNEQLNVYARWLYKVSLNKRSADQILMTVQ